MEEEKIKKAILKLAEWIALIEYRENSRDLKADGFRPNDFQQSIRMYVNEIENILK